MTDREEVKKEILHVFNTNVKGLKPDLSNLNEKHDGREGDWLTKRMGLSVNGKNEPDFKGFEMKKDSRGKTTFGDWGPDIAIYKGASKVVDREKFLELFGAPNASKNNRFSWSGRVFPNVQDFNYAGQKMQIASEGIEIIYKRKKDSRNLNQNSIYQDHLRIALWTHDSLRKKLESKFNNLGWFRCLKDRSGNYSEIVFGKPITYEAFLDLFSQGHVYLDCGMHQGNARPYMSWRANNHVWEKLAE